MKYLILLFNSFFLFSNKVLANNNNLKVIFRFDDFTLVNNDYQDSIINLFSDNNIPLTLAAIPFDQSENPKPINSIDIRSLEKIKSLIKEKELEIALHGFNHKNNANSEFKNGDINLQYEMIKGGKEFLDSILAAKIVTFIPPFNSYDIVTLKVLSSLGFKLISADIYGIGNYDKILYLPSTYDSLYGLKNIITNNLYKNVILVVMFHKYNITGYLYEYNVKRNSFSEVNEPQKWINSTGVNCYTYSQLIESGENLNSNRYNINVKYFNGIITKRMDFEKVYVPANYIFFKIIDILFWISYYFVVLIILTKPLNSIFNIDSSYYLMPVIIIMSVILIAILLYGRFTDKFLLLINGTISLILGLLYLRFK